jgi:hypothetical protein
MRDMARTPEEAPAMAEALLRTWLTDQHVNGFAIPARPTMQTLLDRWPRSPDGTLDLARAPLRLLAIVNRVDQRDLSRATAGEGRFVFGVVGPNGEPEEFTIILEYALPAKTEAEIRGWIDAWHALGALPFPSEAYNAALEALTLRFSGRGAAPGRPNGNALDQLRTNEFTLEPRWELRQFALSADTGLLAPAPVALTPDLSLDNTDRLARYINENEAAIIAERHVVPAEYEGSPFLGGAVFNDLIGWAAPGVRSSEARFRLSLNTCNGCHGSTETNTAFLQIQPRLPGRKSALSPFLAGTTVFDPVTREQRQLNDLARRKSDLTSLVCPTPPPRPTPRENALEPHIAPTLTLGLRRAH